MVSIGALHDVIIFKIQMMSIAFLHISGLCWVTEAEDLNNGRDSISLFFIIISFFFFFFFFDFLLPIKDKEEEKAMPPLLSSSPRSDSHQSVKGSNMLEHQQRVEGLAVRGSCGWAGNFLLMAELRIKIMSFRDILDLPPCNGSTPMNELLMGTVVDLYNLYPTFVSCPPTSEMISAPTYQGLRHFYEALRSVGNSWCEIHKWCDKSSNEKDCIVEELSLEQLGEMVLERLGYMNTVAKENYDLMDEEDQKNANTVDDSQGSTFRYLLKDSHSFNKFTYCKSPHTPTSVLPDTTPYSPHTSTSVLPDTTPNSLNNSELPNVSYLPPLLLPLRRKAMGLKPIDVKRLSFHMFPHVSIQTFYSVNQINKVFDTSKPHNCEISESKAVPMDVTIGSVNSMIEMDDIPNVLNPVSHDVSSEEVDNVSSPVRQSVLPPNPSPPPMLLAKESSLPPLPQPQPMLPQIQSALPTTPSLTPKHSVPPALPPPMLMPKQSSTPPLPLPLAPRHSAPPALMLPPKQSSSPPPPPLPKQSALPLPPPPPPRILSQKESTLLPPPPVLPSKESAVSSLLPAPSVPPKEYVFPPPPMTLSKGLTPPPPPPLGVNKALRPKKGNTKLKRSTQMGSLYQLLKGKVEGSSLSGKMSHVKKGQVGGSPDNTAKGMADALAEITKRSAYFQQIEEDVLTHATSILEMTSAINSFQTKDMTELRKFHNYVELHLEDLTDETQVLARFEHFPSKKLETIRTAAAMYSKLDGIATNLESWKIEVPLVRQLEKVECYFNKIKVEVDGIERNKDEEAKRFQNHKIEFDFNVLLRIKEFMVDVSSNCIEMVLKESKEAKADADTEGGNKHCARLKACSKTLWKAFQLAFRVYNFAGGQDDRADKLTSELAQEIESYSNHY